MCSPSLHGWRNRNATSENVVSPRIIQSFHSENLSVKSCTYCISQQSKSAQSPNYYSMTSSSNYIGVIKKTCYDQFLNSSVFYIELFLLRWGEYNKNGSSINQTISWHRNYFFGHVYIYCLMIEHYYYSSYFLWRTFFCRWSSFILK